ncbi:unnamed protein product [Durusdinium trenchii]|uniref:Uncharacterized protein n=1 Tax=Durusdinium trenchii TaxID=1381693 RepID=A0ABP0RP15_9DINO
MVPVRGKSRYKHIEEVRAWPILYLSSWFRTAFQHPYDGFFLLGGYKINHLDSIKGMLRHFWERYKGIDDVCPHDPELTIPFFLHGDEGRGQCHRPVLVLAAQPIIGWKGEECVTSTQHTFTTRLLLTVIPAQHYAANGATMQAVLRAVVDDFNELSQNGVEVTCGDVTQKFYMQFCGTKGDWPFIRSCKSFHGDLARDRTRESCRDLFRIVRWGHISISKFLRIIYKGKLWLTPLQAAEAVQSGFNFCTSCWADEDYIGKTELSSPERRRSWTLRKAAVEAEEAGRYAGRKPFEEYEILESEFFDLAGMAHGVASAHARGKNAASRGAKGSKDKSRRDRSRYKKSKPWQHQRK